MARLRENMPTPVTQVRQSQQRVGKGASLTVTFELTGSFLPFLLGSGPYIWSALGLAPRLQCPGKGTQISAQWSRLEEPLGSV